MKEELRAAYAYLGKGEVTLVHGDCPDGADAIADLIWTLQFGKDFVEKHPADWAEHGKKAGYIRNKAMVDTKPDLVLAFQVDSSKGTQHTIDLVKAADLEVNLFEDFLVPPF
jgi:hypothetical protein